MSKKVNKNSKNTGKKKRKKKKSKKGIIFLCALLIIGIPIGVVSYKYYSLYQKGGIKYNKNYVGHNVDISIRRGTSPKQISEALQQIKVVDNSLLFYLKSKNDGIAENFKAGQFVLNTAMDYNEVVEVLQNPQKENELKLLVREGDTQEDIARSLDKMNLVTYDEFMNACNTMTFNYKFLKDLPKDEARKSKLEGYLYPDTYFLSEDDTAETIINKLLSRFDQLYTDDMAKKAKSLGLTTDEVVIMASIIEKEVKYAPEKNIVASVINNRIKEGIKLQMDATVLYAKGKHTNRTLTSDTKIESPYNTYMVQGLPIGPISNPSIDTINAVLNPANTGYLYYVVKNDKTGEHFFTSNYEQFLDAKDNYLKKFN